MTDLISRQDAIEVINKLMEIHFDRKVVLGKVWQQIKDLPSAQPEVLACGEGESTSNGIMLMIGDDGVAREYSDEFDVVIHCESAEEREKVIEIINSKQRILCSERLHEKSCLRCVFSEPTPAGIRKCKNLDSSLFGRESTEELWCSNFTEAADVPGIKVGDMISRKGEIEEPARKMIPYSIEDGTVTIDVSSISDKIRGCRIELHFGKAEGEEDG